LASSPSIITDSTMSAPKPPVIPVFDVGNVLIEWDPRHLYRQVFADEAAMEHFLAMSATKPWNEEQDRGRSFGEGCAPGRALPRATNGDPRL